MCQFGLKQRSKPSANWLLSKGLILEVYTLFFSYRLFLQTFQMLLPTVRSINYGRFFFVAILHHYIEYETKLKMQGRQDFRLQFKVVRQSVTLKFLYSLFSISKINNGTNSWQAVAWPSVACKRSHKTLWVITRRKTTANVTDGRILSMVMKNHSTTSSRSDACQGLQSRDGFMK